MVDDTKLDESLDGDTNEEEDEDTSVAPSDSENLPSNEDSGAEGSETNDESEEDEEGAGKEPMIPKSRLDEVSGKLHQAEEELTKLRAGQAGTNDRFTEYLREGSLEGDRGRDAMADHLLGHKMDDLRSKFSHVAGNETKVYELVRDRGLTLDQAAEAVHNAQAKWIDQLKSEAVEEFKGKARQGRVERGGKAAGRAGSGKPVAQMSSKEILDLLEQQETAVE